jgi:hypothetical protein
VALLLSAVPAGAQYTRDDSAEKKIREAIDLRYLPTEFDEAEAMLVGIVAACGDKCSPQTLAKAWMYVGIVRGSGKNNLAGAKEAFGRALALEPGVQLDTALATAATQNAFQEAGGWAAAPAQPAKPPETPAPPPQVAAAPAEGTGLDCTPKATEVETRRAVPVQCRSGTGADSLELRFKPSGEDWQSLKMSRQGDTFRAEIPCNKTVVAAELQLFVRAKDASGDEVGGWGTKADPIRIRFVEKSAQEPPRFDDAGPPARCEAKEDCPPSFPGCGNNGPPRGHVDWGGACSNSSECKQGLLCLDDTCELAPSCQTDADCPAGACSGGKCDIGSSSKPGSPYAKNWFGLHVAQDVMFVGGSDVCTQSAQANENFACYYGGRGERTAAYIDEPYPGTHTSTSPVAATTRILVSYDRAITSHFLAGVRVGYAFGGGPPAGRDLVYDNSGRIVRIVAEGQSFFPFHLEARASYWFGAGALTRKGFRPYVHAGGGLAQVDGKVVVSVKDCGLYAAQGTPAYSECAAGTVPSNSPRLRSVDLDAWKKIGRAFITMGGGVVYAFTETLGAQLNMNLIYTLPDPGFVLEPSLGAIMGF